LDNGNQSNLIKEVSSDLIFSLKVGSNDNNIPMLNSPTIVDEKKN
jgi:hypothetical protein